MKKISTIFNLLLITCFLVSCSSSKQAGSTKKAIDGSWQLQTVVTESIPGKFKMQLFNEADFNCFIGTSWEFNVHNNTGTYTINKNGNECASVKRNIRWTIYEATSDEPKLLQFKRLDDTLKDITDDGNYRFTIVQLDNKNMKLRSDITFEGKPASLVYNFVRN
jgi:Lipocalin-like domain